MAPKGGSEGEKCDVTICRGSTASAQTFAIRVGGVLRIGRGVANDVVLDFEGVSVYHAEIHLQPRAAGEAGPPLLCVRDESKNGTAVRAGPHAEEKADADAWEPLKKGALRILQHGWQVMMPLNSRKNSKQLPVTERLITVFVGSTVPEGFATAATSTLALLTHKVFSAGNAILHRNVKPRVASGGKEAAPPPPEEFSGEFEEAPEPPPLPRGVEEEELEEVEASIMGDQTEYQTEYGDDEKTQQARKKTKKAKKKDKKEKKKKKDKKDKRNKKQEEQSDEEVEDEEEAEDDEDDAKTRNEREEMTRLEQELEDELAEETARKARRGQATTDGDGITDRDGITVDGRTDKDGAESSVAVATEVAGDDGKSVATHTQKVDDSEPESNQEDEIKAAWGRALKTGTEAAAAASTGAEAAEAMDAAEVPAVVEVTGSEAAGTFLRCGVHEKKPKYRRLRDDEQPTYLYFRLGDGDITSTGWCVAGKPGGTGVSGHQEFWKTEADLPATEKGDLGATMQVRAQLDGPALEALAALPEKLRTQLQAAFTAACSGAPIDLEEDGDVSMKGVPEQEEAEAVAMDATAAQEKLEAEKEAQEQSGALSKETEAAASEGETAEHKDAEGAARLFQTAVEAITEEVPAGAGAPATTDQEKAAGKEAERPEALSEETAAGAARMLGRQLEAIAEEAEDKQQGLPKASEEPAKEDDQAKDLEEAEGVSIGAGASVGPEPDADNAEPQAKVDDGADNESLASRGESLPSRASFTTGPGKTVPGGDRAESMAPTNIGERPDSSVDGEDGDKARAKERPKESGLASLTADALARHTEALARAQAEAYAATFATAKTNYAKSVAGMSIAGRSVAGRSVAGNSIAGRSIAGKSVAGRSVAGRSIAASGVAPTEKTFRTHVTTREMLVGPSQMREIMRSVSPISEPGVMSKRRRRRFLREVSPCSVESVQSQRKKKKKDKKKGKGGRRAVSLHPRQASPSHYAGASPTPGRPEGSATPFDRQQSEFSMAPSHWQAEPTSPPPSETVVRKKKGKKPKGAREGKKKGKKKAQQTQQVLREASETAEPPRAKKKRTQK